jgi:ribosomal protein L19
LKSPSFMLVSMNYEIQNMHILNFRIYSRCQVECFQCIQDLLKNDTIFSMSDPNMGNRQNRFVGICIRRHHEGMFHSFTLRNVVDGLGWI